jgi:hypothetical protein
MSIDAVYGDRPLVIAWQARRHLEVCAHTSTAPSKMTPSSSSRNVRSVWISTAAAKRLPTAPGLGLAGYSLTL